MVRPMPLGVPFDVPTGDGEVAEVTFIDANHCPGSVLVHLRCFLCCVARAAHRGFSSRSASAARTPRPPPSYVIMTARSTSSCWTPRTARLENTPRTRTTCHHVLSITPFFARVARRTPFLARATYQIGKKCAVLHAAARAANSRAVMRWHRARTQAVAVQGRLPVRVRGRRTPPHATRTLGDAPDSGSSRRVNVDNAVKGDGMPSEQVVLDDKGPSGAVRHHRLSPREPPTLVRRAARSGKPRVRRTIHVGGEVPAATSIPRRSRGTPPSWRSDRRGGRTPAARTAMGPVDGLLAWASTCA